MARHTADAARRNILAATRHCCATYGLSGASIAVIAREAGCSKATVLYHFTSRDEILRDLLAPLWAALGQLARELEGLDDPDAAQQAAIAGMVEIGVSRRQDLAAFYGELAALLDFAQFGEARQASNTIRRALTRGDDGLVATLVATAAITGCASICHEFYDAPEADLEKALRHIYTTVCMAPMPVA